MKKQKNKQFKQIENQAQDGRSMVEMLGVLAIIGVISVGGIAGYRWGMNKHVANQILYEMNLNSAQLALLLQRGNSEGVKLSLGSPYDEKKFRTVEYGFEYGCGEGNTGHECSSDETGYFMTVTGLPKQVCNMLGDAVFGMAYYDDSAINNGENNHECQDADNTVTVFFNTNATAEGETSPRPGNSDNPSTPTPEVTAATPTTADTSPSTYTTENPCNHGQLVNGRCVCDWGWEGDDCLTCTDDSTCNCGEHGGWCGSFCFCYEIGWSGEDCSQQQDKCNGHGLWADLDGGRCYECKDGYGGTYCETADATHNLCHDNGSWNGWSGTCNCAMGWKGDDCNTPACNGKGYWYKYQNYCDCKDGYGGPECEKPNACNGRGSWYSSGGRCICNSSGWLGTYCDKCRGKGMYYNADTGKCSCDSGWSGDDCEIETRDTIAPLYTSR